jgi:hypothetical protein
MAKPGVRCHSQNLVIHNEYEIGMRGWQLSAYPLSFKRELAWRNLWRIARVVRPKKLHLILRNRIILGPNTAGNIGMKLFAFVVIASDQRYSS